MLWVGSQVGTIYSINVLFLFSNSIIQVVIEIRKKLTSAECATVLCHWLTEFSGPCEVGTTFLFVDEEVGLDEASWLIQGPPASKQQCQNPSSFYSTPNTTLTHQCHLHSSLCPNSQSRLDVYYIMPFKMQTLQIFILKIRTIFWNY